MKSLDNLLELHELTQGNWCPGTLLALHMAVLGCALAGISTRRGLKQAGRLGLR